MAHGRWPEAGSQVKEERNVAAGVNLVRRLRFEARTTVRKGSMVDYHGVLPDHVLDLWEAASPLGPFFWWPEHARLVRSKRRLFIPLRASCRRWASTAPMRFWLATSARCGVVSWRPAGCRCGPGRGPDGKLRFPGSGVWFLHEKLIFHRIRSRMRVACPRFSSGFFFGWELFGFLWWACLCLCVCVSVRSFLPRGKQDMCACDVTAQANAGSFDACLWRLACLPANSGQYTTEKRSDMQLHFKADGLGLEI